MKRRAVWIVAAIALAITAYLLGASRAPTREVRTVASVNVTRLKVVEKERIVLDTEEARRLREGARVTRVITRHVPGPGCTGPTVERTEETIDTTREETTDTSTVATSERESEENMSRVERVTVTELVERDRERFSLGADLAMKFKGENAVLMRGRFEVRPIGSLPWWIGVVGDRETIGASVRIAW